MTMEQRVAEGSGSGLDRGYENGSYDNGSYDRAREGGAREGGRHAEGGPSKRRPEASGNDRAAVPAKPSAAMLANGARAGGVSVEVAWRVYQAMLRSAD